MDWLYGSTLDLESPADVMVLLFPLLLAGTVLEVVVSKLYSDKNCVEKSFRLNESINTLCVFVMDGISKVFISVFKTAPYAFVFENYRLMTLPSTFATWVFVLIGVEFCYYLFHRAAHECSFLWAAHQLHHSGEDFNVLVTIRQSMFQHLFSWIFYIPLAILGVTPKLFLFHLYVSTLYMFWIHTKCIPKLPRWIEFIFNTPSHHRVHHGRNPYCIDINYGSILIVFDRLFGTFSEERLEGPRAEVVRYGLVYQELTFNAFYQNTYYYIVLVKKIIKYKTLSVVWKKPSYIPGGPPDGPKIIEKDELSVRHDPSVPINLQCYAFVQILVLLLVSWLVMISEDYRTLEDKMVWGSIVGIWVFSISTIIDNQPISLIADLVRFIFFQFCTQRFETLLDNSLPSCLAGAVNVSNLVQMFLTSSALFSTILHGKLFQFSQTAPIISNSS